MRKKNQLKKLAALAVAALVVSQSGVIAARAEEEVNKTEEEVNKLEEETNKVEEETNGLEEEANKVEEETNEPEEEANSVEARAILAAADDLQWDYSGQPGSALFTIPNEKGTAFYQVDVWRNGEYFGPATNEKYSDKEKGEKAYVFAFHGLSLGGSGVYKLQVTTFDLDGKIVGKSPFTNEWDYTEPDKSLSIPRNVSWSKDGVFSCEREADDNFGQYEFSVRDANGNNVGWNFGSPILKGKYDYKETENGVTFNLTKYLADKNVTPENGYHVFVRATSNNAIECKDSEWSSAAMFGNEPYQGGNETHSGSSDSKTEVEVKEWKPITPDEVKRYGAYSKEAVSYTANEKNAYPVIIKNAMQGKLCYDVFESVQGDYTIGRTYNILPNGKAVYKMDTKAQITLTIPKALQAEGRVFRMICVTENGIPTVLKDLDSNPETITFETDAFYAFALVYKDGAK